MQRKLFGNKKRIADIILIAVILVTALSVFIITELTKKKGDFVRVSVDGNVVAEYPLSQDGEYILNGGTNILVIEDGEAFLVYSDCPDKTCVHGNSIFGGKISDIGEEIVCLPNGVVIRIVGDGEGVLEV